MKYFQSQEILITTPPPVVNFSTTSGFALQGITACFFARHLYKFRKHCPKAAVPNLWVATPSGVAIDFHWGRHWSSNIKKIHAQLHIHNVFAVFNDRSCRKQCYKSYEVEIT